MVGTCLTVWHEDARTKLGCASAEYPVITEELRFAVEYAMVRELSFLFGVGYTFSGVQQQASNALGTYLEGRFTNAAVNREVLVVYLPANGAPRSVAITSVVLVVPVLVDEVDYTTTNSMGVCVTDLSASGSILSRLEDHIRTSADILQKRMEAVLDGRAWQADQLDWCGMK